MIRFTKCAEELVFRVHLTGNPGPRVSDWLGNIATKAASGAWKTVVKNPPGLVRDSPAVNTQENKRTSPMPVSNLLKSASGTCQYCGDRAEVLTQDHPECRRTHQHGWDRMVQIAADAARTHSFDEKSLRLSLAEIAHNCHGDGPTVNEALEEGWKRGVAHAMADGIISQHQENNISDSRDHLGPRHRLC